MIPAGESCPVSCPDCWCPAVSLLYLENLVLYLVLAVGVLLYLVDCVLQACLHAPPHQPHQQTRHQEYCNNKKNQISVIGFVR